MVGDRALARPPGGWGGGGLRHALRIERDVPFWGGAYTYDGSQFAPRGVHPSQTVSWFLCPLIADAGDLGWLFPLDLVLGTVLYTHILHLGFHTLGFSPESLKASHRAAYNVHCISLLREATEYPYCPRPPFFKNCP